MPHMPTYEEIRADFARGVRTAEQRIEHPFRHDGAAQQTPAPGPVTLASAPPKENPVTMLSEGKTLLHDALDKLESLDEGAIGVVEAIKVNPTAISITNTLASIAHLPDPQGLLGSADGILKQFAAILSKGAADTALTTTDATADAQPSYTPAGPQVAGQA